MSITLPLLNKSSTFIHTVNTIRQEGWLDWHILHAITMVVINHKLQSYYSRCSSIDEVKDIADEKFKEDEKNWYELIPEEILNEERLLQELNIMMPITFLPAFGLTYKSEIPNGKAILQLIKEKYNFFEDGKDILIFS
ncbi:hypothetical protein [Flavipsychrobacter stenotrophus]|nr:hypothetical protein [Flavipsychrobacter stenotrophus]